MRLPSRRRSRPGGGDAAKLAKDDADAAGADAAGRLAAAEQIRAAADDQAHRDRGVIEEIREMRKKNNLAAVILGEKQP